MIAGFDSAHAVSSAFQFTNVPTGVWIDERGRIVRKINLKVRVDNVAAIRLYERMGWVHEGRTTRDTLIDGAFADCLLMGREVDPA